MKKHCLFCEEMVPTKSEGDYDIYIGCSCSPDGFYSLLTDSYQTIRAFPHQKKRDMLHLVSAYIREQTDCGEKVALSASDLEAIVHSPNIPVTIEDKGIRLLQYLYRHSMGPGEPVVIQPLASCYNLTYSPNLQELVYIIDKLQNEQLLIREGTAFQLTEKGWSEAAASTGGKKLKPCTVLISAEEILGAELLHMLLSKIEQYGYKPRLLTPMKAQSPDKYSLEEIADSKLVVADLSGQSLEVYFAAGYALGLNIPVIWTMKSSDAEMHPVKIKEIRPIVWNTAEELANILQQRLGG